jgi:hypothetical protein
MFKVGDLIVLSGIRDSWSRNAGKVFKITVHNNKQSYGYMIDDLTQKIEPLYLGERTTFDLYKKAEVKTNKPIWF